MNAIKPPPILTTGFNGSDYRNAAINSNMQKAGLQNTLVTSISHGGKLKKGGTVVPYTAPLFNDVAKGTPQGMQSQTSYVSGSLIQHQVNSGPDSLVGKVGGFRRRRRRTKKITNNSIKRKKRKTVRRKK
jgi:hypothetical protein